MTRKQILNPEGTDTVKAVPSTVADPAQTGDSLPQYPEGSQGAAAT
jgi:hypothetical protein